MLKTKAVFLLAIFWTAFVTAFSLMSLGDLGDDFPIPNKDKYVHFMFYFVFVSVWYLYLNKKNSASRNKWMVLIAAICFGILMEICQGAFTTTRSPDIFDVIANTVGAIFGLLFITTILKNKPNNKIPQ